MYDHLKLLVDKFGKEILNFGSIYNPSFYFGEVYIPCEYHSLWDAILIHANKNSFFSIVTRLLDLNLNPNLSSFELSPQVNKYTFLDKVIFKININEGGECDKLIKVGKYLYKKGATSATKKNDEIEEIYKRLDL